ncbi:hypothetical protein RND71_007582 [Anisodus tanguticus]|uniref:Uncharacterized protein n=1 Tax=Anisodus tanguticus TaxID=243964 RepID=A0AAE1SMM1_9SOLA|nr:hypothetical protein RND71_007582 [Anisodus tanguticus]
MNRRVGRAISFSLHFSPFPGAHFPTLFLTFSLFASNPECGVAVKVVKMEQVVANSLESQVVVDDTRSLELLRPDLCRLSFAASSEFM